MIGLSNIFHLQSLRYVNDTIYVRSAPRLDQGHSRWNQRNPNLQLWTQQFHKGPHVQDLLKIQGTQVSTWISSKPLQSELKFHLNQVPKCTHTSLHSSRVEWSHLYRSLFALLDFHFWAFQHSMSPRWEVNFETLLNFGVQRYRISLMRFLS